MPSPSSFTAILRSGEVTVTVLRWQVVIDEADYYAGRADVSAAIDQQQLPRDPRFLYYDSFQEPIKVRLMVKFGF